MSNVEKQYLTKSLLSIYLLETLIEWGGKNAYHLLLYILSTIPIFFPGNPRNEKWIENKKREQTKQKSAKLKINLINTTMEQNRAQEIVKINEEIGRKVGKPWTLIE